MIRQLLLLVLVALCVLEQAQSFHVTFMAKRGKGSLKKRLDEDGSSGSTNPNSLNKGLGQEITGVSLPPDGAVKGWEFGEKKTMVCANVGGRFYALE